MKLLKKLNKNIAVASKKVYFSVKNNAAELYTMFVLFVGVPTAVAWITSLEWGVLLSFVFQAVIGVLYLRGKE